MPSKKTDSKKIDSKKSAEKAPTKKVQPVVKTDQTDTLGHRVWWDLMSANGKREHLERLLTEAGYESYMPDELTFERRLRIAKRKVQKGRGIDFKYAGRDGQWSTWRPIKVEKTEDSSAAKDEHKKSVKTDILGAISLNRESGEMTAENPDSEIAKALRAEYDALEGTFDHFQTTELLAKILEREFNGLKVSRTGGNWFVPEMDEHTEPGLRAIQKVIQNIGESDLYVEPVLTGSDSARSATRTAASTFDAMYSELFNDAEGFVASLESGDLANGRSLKAKLETASRLGRQVDLYNDVLADRGAQIAKASAAVSETVKEIVKASVEVRSLQKAKDSEIAQKAAAELIGKIAKSARTALVNARKIHEPSIPVDDESAE